MNKDYLMTGTTESGFQWEIDMRVMSDMKNVRKLARMFADGVTEGEQIALTMDYYDAVLGIEQVERLDSHIRSMNDGFCPSDIFDKEVTEIINSCKEVKK